MTLATGIQGFWPAHLAPFRIYSFYSPRISNEYSSMTGQCLKYSNSRGDNIETTSQGSLSSTSPIFYYSLVLPYPPPHSLFQFQVPEHSLPLEHSRLPPPLAPFPPVVNNCPFPNKRARWRYFCFGWEREERAKIEKGGETRTGYKSQELTASSHQSNHWTTQL